MADAERHGMDKVAKFLREKGAKDDTSIRLDQQAERDIRNTTDYGSASGGRPRDRTGTAAELAALTFDDIDKNGDGSISREEYEEAMHSSSAGTRSPRSGRR